MRIIFVALPLLLLALPVRAQTLCTEPVNPICVDELTTYEDELTQSRCEQDIKEFASEMQAYTRCLNRQAKEASQSAQKVLERFQCLKSGRKDCPQTESSTL